MIELKWKHIISKPMKHKESSFKRQVLSTKCIHLKKEKNLMRSHIDNVTIYLEISRTTRRSNTQKRVDEKKNNQTLGGSQ